MRWLPQYSLRTLVFFVMLIGSGMATVRNWQPWFIRSTFKVDEPVQAASISPDHKLIAIVLARNTWTLNANTGQKVLRLGKPDQGILAYQLIAFSDDGQLMLNGLADPEFDTPWKYSDLTIWDTITGHEVRVFRDDNEHNGLQRIGKTWLIPRHLTNYAPYAPFLNRADEQDYVFLQSTGLDLEYSARPNFVSRDIFRVDGNTVIVASTDSNQNHDLRIYFRCHPENWWGVALLPAFWLAIVLAAGFVWSVRKDLKLRSQ